MKFAGLRLSILSRLLSVMFDFAQVSYLSLSLASTEDNTTLPLCPFQCPPSIFAASAVLPVQTFVFLSTELTRCARHHIHIFYSLLLSVFFIDQLSELYNTTLQTSELTNCIFRKSYCYLQTYVSVYSDLVNCIFRHNPISIDVQNSTSLGHANSQCTHLHAFQTVFNMI